MIKILTGNSLRILLYQSDVFHYLVKIERNISFGAHRIAFPLGSSTM